MKQRDPETVFTDYLKKHHLRVTPERMAVLDAALESRAHFDADQLFLALKNKGSKVSRATVYNTLEKLREAGLLVKSRFGERLAKYEITLGTQPHHHLICRSCGRIEEFVDKRVDRMARDAAACLDHELEDAVLHIYGVCPSCRKKNI